MINQVFVWFDIDWLFLVEVGVEFVVSGLLVVVLDLLVVLESCQVVYVDEFMCLDDGELGVVLCLDLNFDFLFSFFVGLFWYWLFCCELLFVMGGFDEIVGEVFELVYQLCFVEQWGLGCIGYISELLLFGLVLCLQDSIVECVVIEGYLCVCGYVQVIVGSWLLGCYELDYGYVG